MSGYDKSTGVDINCWFCSTTIRNCIIKNNYGGATAGVGIRINGFLTTLPVIVNTVFVMMMEWRGL
jgi:hypothetical protein